MLTILLILSQPILATVETCCSQHGDICGDKCCDGTPFPKHCGTLQIISLPPVSSPNSTSPLPVEKKNPKVLDEQKKGGNKSSLPKKWLYTWENPKTGALCLSSTSPPWYRNAQYPLSKEYPRVQVFDEYHRLVDDTERPPNVTMTQPKPEQKKNVEIPPQ